MAKLIHQDEATMKLTEALRCPWCKALFEIKAEDIYDVTDVSVKEGYVKCPNCTNELLIKESNCVNPIVKGAFSEPLSVRKY